MADSNAQEKPAQPAQPKKRGFTFKQGVKAPKSLIEALEPVKGIKPSEQLPAKSLVREMFGSKPAKKNVPKPVATKPVAPKPRPVSLPLGKVDVDAAAKAKAEEGATETELIPPEGEGLLELLEQQEAPPTLDAEVPADLGEMGELIKEEEKKDLYGTTMPPAYVPQTRRGFSEFIKLQYKPYILTDAMKVNKDDKFYKYQEFVRDYMRTRIRKNLYCDCGRRGPLCDIQEKYYCHEP